jgi:hypothetical protein
MCLRWTAAGMLEAEQQFRKIIGFSDLANLAIAVQSVAAAAHHGDDLLRARRISRVASALAARWTAGEIARHRRRRYAPAGRVQRRCSGHKVSEDAKRVLQLLPGDHQDG